MGCGLMGRRKFGEKTYYERIFDIIKDRPCTTQELMDVMGLTESQLKRAIRSLSEREYIVFSRYDMNLKTQEYFAMTTQRHNLFRKRTLFNDEE